MSCDFTPLFISLFWEGKVLRKITVLVPLIGTYLTFSHLQWDIYNYIFYYSYTISNYRSFFVLFFCLFVVVIGFFFASFFCF